MRDSRGIVVGKTNGQNAHVSSVLREPVVMPPLTKEYNDTRGNLQHSRMHTPMVLKTKAMGPTQPFLAVIRIHCVE